MEEVVIRVAHEIAAAIEQRDTRTLATLIAPGFAYRTPGGASQDAEAFLNGVQQIPGDIVFVRIGDVVVDLSVAGALVTGVQHARVRIDGHDVDDRRAFVDWFVRDEGKWLIRCAVDLPLVRE